jgi:hypothetical protein
MKDLDRIELIRRSEMRRFRALTQQLTSDKSSPATNVNPRAKRARRAYFILFAFFVLALIAQGAIHFSNKKKSPATSKSDLASPEQVSGRYDHALEQWRLLILTFFI